MSQPTRRDRADAIRFLSIDAVQKANSGHPGMPMGMADIAEVLWHDFLRHNPLNPHWMNRDRFMLSNGHGAMLQYALLHLAGYDLTIEDIKQFRQLHSRTPGHPEFGETPGVETTTGPLGQGIANAVGMAIAEKHLASLFNKPGFPIIDHYTYCFAGDGCLMEGISHEACSLAGTLGLGKLIVFYDDNGISIDGEVVNWFRDNTPLRFEAYGWHVIPNVNGHDSEAIHQAIIAAQAVTDKPTLICCKTTIGWGSPNLAGKAETHGAALGEKEIAAVRTQLNWPHTPFVIPEEVYASWDARQKGTALEKAWQALFDRYQHQYPELAKELLRRIEGRLPADWQTQADKLLHELNEKKQSVATRKASQLCLNLYANHLPEMMGGSADLTESNCTNWQGMKVFSDQVPEGRYIHYGVREFGMSAIMNGLALYKGIIPFGGTFLTFSDYARNAIRLASLMRQRVIFVYTHDSIGLGEDGPTHQPVEQLPGLRLMPGLSVWRPCDTVETAVAWRAAIERQGPTCLLFSRQALPHQERHPDQLPLVQRGGYILLDYADGKPDAILIATGSEVALAVEAAKQLKDAKIYVRVVSMPSTDVFLAQDENYRNQVLPGSVLAKVAIEAAAGDYWYRFVGLHGKVIGMNRFGASAPAKDVFRDCGFTVDHVVAITKEVIYSAANASLHFDAKCASGMEK
ncbi:transketolase [Aquicella lusitana]|uniref:Transketolase n=1 Tax=Aquicella lusitana TaxID=254246 RepID=A0A370GF16_9COXI|nr:transketolase [Aquicella lusitana]RDI42402.1 transketolase [Aquicella lusitana]VVC74136.1 Transketolase 1 [Aquicella lusitana]